MVVYSPSNPKRFKVESNLSDLRFDSVSLGRSIGFSKLSRERYPTDVPKEWDPGYELIIKNDPIKEDSVESTLDLSNGTGSNPRTSQIYIYSPQISINLNINPDFGVGCNLKKSISELNNHILSTLESSLNQKLI